LGWRDWAKRVFNIGIYVVVAAVLLQFFFGGLVIFVDSAQLGWHLLGAAVLFFLPIILALAGWLGRVGWRVILLTLAVPVLVFVQALLIGPYREAVQGPLRIVAAFHVVNALVIFWVALLLLDRVRHPTLVPTAAEMART
jgi:Family of unknown function (DUF6220)